MQSQQRGSAPSNRPVRKPVPDRSYAQRIRDDAMPAMSDEPQPAHHQPNTSPTQALLSPSPNTTRKNPILWAKEKTPDSGPASGTSERRSTSIVVQLCITCACFAVTAWFAQATFSNEESSKTRDVLRDVFKVDIRDTLTVLAVLSGLLGLLSGVSIDTALETVQWWLICRKKGASVSTILSVSPTTGVLGSFKLLYGRGPSPGARSWAAAKLSLRLAIWVSGVVLFVNTKLATFYKPTFTFDAQTGVGPFDPFYATSYLNRLSNFNMNASQVQTVIPYTALSLAHNIVVNPQHSISVSHDACSNDTCSSYVLPGAIELCHPYPPTNYSDDPVLLFNNVPATQIDFRHGLDEGDFFADEDCELFFQHPYKIAIRFCLAPSPQNEGSILSTIYVCDQGSIGNTCLSNYTTPPSISTSFSLYANTASLVVSRSNSSILSLSELGTPIADHSLNLTAYRGTIRWLLNNTAAGIPAPSSAMEYFWSTPTQLSSEFWSTGTRHALHSLLAYPFWLFQVNNVANPLLVNDTSAATVLPAEFQTTASIARPFTKIVVNRGMFITFVVLQSLILLFAWVLVVLGWCTKVQLPKVSEYPLSEFSFRTRYAQGPSTISDAGSPVPTTNLDDVRDDLARELNERRGGDRDMLAVVRDARVNFKGKIKPR